MFPVSFSVHRRTDGGILANSATGEFPYRHNQRTDSGKIAPP